MKSSGIVVRCIKSSCGLTDVIGRYACMSLYANGSFKILTDNGWLELRATKDSIQKIKAIALRDKGSLYVEIKPSGVGYVFDRELREEA